MMEKFECMGIWWLPENPEKRLPGILKFTPDEGGVLELIGSFKNKRLGEMNNLIDPEIIVGVSSHGKNITLYKCLDKSFEVQPNFVLPELQFSSYYVNVIFIGVHFKKPEDVKFRSLYVHFSHLDEWIDASGFEIQNLLDKKEITISYKKPIFIQAVVGDYKITVESKVSYPTLSLGKREVSIKQKSYIKIESPKGISFYKYPKIMNHIQNFLTLGFMKPVYPMIIKGKTEVNKKLIKDKPYYPAVEVYYELPDIPKVPKKLSSFDMLFTFKDISGRFEFFFKNWFEKADLLEPVYNLYFGPLYNPQMYLQNQFLSVIQAIETYHRRKFEGKYISDEDYKPIYNRFKEIINKLDIEASFKDVLKSKLKYGSEYSLRKRLKDLFEKYAVITQNFIKDKNNFINIVVETRNYLTHYDKKLRDIANGGVLYNITEKLRTILQICLLDELGFDKEEIKSMFSRNRRYKAALLKKLFQ